MREIASLKLLTSNNQLNCNMQGQYLPPAQRQLDSVFWNISQIFTYKLSFAKKDPRHLLPWAGAVDVGGYNLNSKFHLDVLKQRI